MSQTKLLVTVVATILSTLGYAGSLRADERKASSPAITILDQDGRVAPNARPSATSQIIDVTVAPGGQLRFSPDILNINVGDTVRWTWAAGGHNVRSGNGCSANGMFCSPSDTGCTSNPLSATGTVYSHTFGQAGIFTYYCSAHCSAGMGGMVTVGSAPTVTDVVVLATTPNNGTTPFNTGTSTVRITGTDFTGVNCPGDVFLDDRNGVGNVVGTNPVTCSVDSTTQITATFPAGIRTNGPTGWNVRVNNVIGANTTSAVKFVPRAGLLISEVYTGSSAAGTDHEFVEVYNPTATILSASALGLHLHTRNVSGTDADKALTAVTSGNIPVRGFLLLTSSASTAGDAWFAHRDYTYSAALVADGGVYVSLSAAADAQVLDKVGWGMQAFNGFEGNRIANIGSDTSAERKPAGAAGHATDTDDNLSDFNPPSGVITPRGSADPPQPASFVLITSVIRQNDGHFIVDGQTLPNAIINIETSPDLVTAFGNPVPVTADGTGAFHYDDAGAAGQAMRFYHAVYP